MSDLKVKEINIKTSAGNFGQERVLPSGGTRKNVKVLKKIHKKKSAGSSVIYPNKVKDRWTGAFSKEVTDLSNDSQSEAADRISQTAEKAFSDIKHGVSKAKTSIKKKSSEALKKEIKKRNVKYTIRKRNTEVALKGRPMSVRKVSGRKRFKIKNDNKVLSGSSVAKKIMQKNRRAAKANADEESTKKITDVALKSVKAIVKMVKDVIREVFRELIRLLMATGIGEAIMIIIVLILLLTVVLIFVVSAGSIFSLSSGFGLLSEDNSPTITSAVNELNNELEQQVEELKERYSGQYDTYEITGGAAIVSNWNDILVVYVKKASKQNIDVSILGEEQEELLRETFWEMTNLSSWLGRSEDGKKQLRINVHSMNYRTYGQIYGMTDEDIDDMKMLMESASDNMKSVTGSYVDISMSEEDMESILNGLSNIPSDRQEVVKAAYSLIGKVGYFWGGKSYVSGWDSRWGTIQQITSGDEAGQYKPYGMDCSGFVGWTFAQAFNGYRCTQGAANQYKHWCRHISWHEVLPGDLIFFEDLSHVGIVASTHSDGTLTIIHCSHGAGGVTVGQYKQEHSAFYLAGRPSNYK